MSHTASRKQCTSYQRFEKAVVPDQICLRFCIVDYIQAKVETKAYLGLLLTLSWDLPTYRMNEISGQEQQLL